MTRYLLATRSAHKAQEIRRILAQSDDLDLVTLADLDVPEISAEDELEVAPTFLGNARAKALFFARLTGLPAVADDSGLEVAALGNKPGVRTRRFALDAGLPGLTGDSLDRANNQLLLDRLRNTPLEQRTARYVCAAVVATPAALVHAALGCCTGAIALEPRGLGGFGYDPIFLIPEIDATVAQLTPLQKDARSHRARAFRALSTVLI